MKKTIISLILAFSAATVLHAQAVDKIRYQAVIRDQTDKPVVNKTTGMRIQIRGGSVTGHLVYEETHNPRTGPEGLATIDIGTGSVTTGVFSAIKWHTGPYFVKTEIDLTGGTSYTLITSGELLSVPYALYAQSAGKIEAGIPESQGLDDVIAIGDSAGRQIKDVADPTEPQDAMTVNYMMEKLIASGSVRTNSGRPVMDYEGNIYGTIMVGDNYWMTENLRATKYHDGTDLPAVTDDATWAGLTTPAYCWYGNPAANSYTAGLCGALYNWYAIDAGNLCPEGWRYPTEEDWNELIDSFDGTDNAGGRLKEAGTKHWLIPNIGADNESGFTALPGGFRSVMGFEGIGNTGFWWSDSETSVDNAGSMALANNLRSTTWLDVSKKTGMSVRCIKRRGVILK